MGTIDGNGQTLLASPPSTLSPVLIESLPDLSNTPWSGNQTGLLELTSLADLRLRAHPDLAQPREGWPAEAADGGQEQLPDDSEDLTPLDG